MYSPATDQVATQARTHTSPLFLVLRLSPFPFPHMHLQYALEFFTVPPPLSPPSSLPTFLPSRTEVTSSVSPWVFDTYTFPLFSHTHRGCTTQHLTPLPLPQPPNTHTHTHTHTDSNPWTTSVTTDSSKVGLHMFYLWDKLYPCILWIHPIWQSNPKRMSQLEGGAHAPMECLR